MKSFANFELPLFQASSGRNREIKQVGVDKVEEIIYQHLFLDKDHRQLDKEVLNRIDGFTKGRMSANILYYYGIKGKNKNNKARFRGIFEGVVLQDAIEYLEILINQQPSRGDIENIREIMNHLKKKLIREENKSDFVYINETDEYIKKLLNHSQEINQNEIDQRKKPVLFNTSNMKSGYRRNPKVAAESLHLAGFKCEINEEHSTFISNKYNKFYMEAHHIIPFSFQHKFPHVSLDVHANILSLCPNCHRLIHHAIESEYIKILDFILKQRADRLAKCDIKIDIETLLHMYKR